MIQLYLTDDTEFDGSITIDNLRNSAYMKIISHYMIDFDGMKTLNAEEREAKTMADLGFTG